jgi:hypothetical protein
MSTSCTLGFCKHSIIRPSPTMPVVQVMIIFILAIKIGVKVGRKSFIMLAENRALAMIETENDPILATAVERSDFGKDGQIRS